MARDWEKLAGEKGRDIPSGRLDRFLRVGKLGVSVGASAAMRKVGGLFGKKDLDDDAAHLGRQAAKVVEVLGQMKGAPMKIGQLLSTDPDMLPPEMQVHMARLQSSAPPMTWNTVKQQLETSLDRPIESVFSWFDPEPVGAASIGQVHRGRLHSGEDVAVKIQYPGVKTSLHADLDNLASALTLGRVVMTRERVDNYIAEIRRAILEEADYLQEADNLRTYGALLSGRKRFVVPQPFEEWTRENVLTMQYIEGQKLDDALLALPPDERDAVAHDFVETYSWMVHDCYRVHGDTHPGNFLLTADGDIGMLDFGCVKECQPLVADGILRLMDACWREDHKGAADLYREMGFGREDAGDSLYDPEFIRQYHDIALKPFLVDEAFDFASWEVRVPLSDFIRKNPKFLKLTPPAESIMVIRVLGGIRGLLASTGVRLNVHRMARECAQRNGFLTGPL